MTIDLVISALGKPFSMARWVDGEYLALQGAEGTNCDGVRYGDELRDALTEALEADIIHVGCSNPRFRIPGMVGGHEMFSEANNKGAMRGFFAALRRREFILVGPDHLSRFPIRPSRHIVTHPTEAFEQRHRIIEQLAGITEGDVVLFAAGPASNVMISALHGKGATLIDIGSALDPYCGVRSRSRLHRYTDITQAERIVVSMATQPHRWKTAEAIVSTMLRSTVKPDAVRLRLNGYDHVPDWAEREGVVVSFGENIGACAKFLGVEDHHDAVWMTIDDDIAYGIDYTRTMIRALARLGGIVGVHGGILNTEDGYWSPRARKFLYSKALHKDTPCNLLGTGTMAFRVRDMGGITFAHFTEHPNLTDPTMSRYAREHGIPMTCIQRQRQWLRTYADTQDSGLELWRNLSDHASYRSAFFGANTTHHEDYAQSSPPRVSLHLVHHPHEPQ